MLSSAIIVFRETLEAALIIGIIAVATRDLRERNAWLGAGIVSGVLGSLLVTLFTGKIADLAQGMGQELFNAGVLGLAAVMLAWHNIWMTRHGMELARDAKQLGQDVSSGSREMSALALVVGLAILREGSETALFLYGLLSGGEESNGGRPDGLRALCGCVAHADADFLLSHQRANFAAGRLHGQPVGTFSGAGRCAAQSGQPAVEYHLAAGQRLSARACIAHPDGL
jgi:high-affinity Fe2+/Pb2+ permease